MKGFISSPTWGFWRVVALGILLQAVITSSTDECTHYYLTQPPDSFTCNPFHHVNPRMRLECSAYCSDLEEYELVWFRLLRDEYNQTHQPQLLSSEIRRVNVEMRGHRSNFTESRLFISNLRLLDVGLYWCQVVIPSNATDIKYFQPSKPVTLLPEESYANLPPCPVRVGLSQHISQCAGEIDEPVTPPYKPAEDTMINPTVVSYSAHLCSTELVPPAIENRLVVPYWSYILIATGVIMIILSVTVFLVALLLYKGRGAQQDCVKASTRITTSSNQTSADIPNSFVSPYLEVSGDADSAETHSSLLSLHAVAQHCESSAADEKTMPSAPKDSTKMKKCPRPPPPPPPKTGGKNSAKLQPKKQVYHSLNAATTIVPSIYTLPSHSTVSAHNTTLALQVQQGKCFDESGAYCNDPRYQPLSPMTTDYLSLYCSTPGREQELGENELND